MIVMPPMECPASTASWTSVASRTTARSCASVSIANGAVPSCSRRVLVGRRAPRGNPAPEPAGDREPDLVAAAPAVWQHDHRSIRAAAGEVPDGQLGAVRVSARPDGPGGRYPRPSRATVVPRRRLNLLCSAQRAACRPRRRPRRRRGWPPQRGGGGPDGRDRGAWGGLGDGGPHAPERIGRICALAIRPAPIDPEHRKWGYLHDAQIQRNAGMGSSWTRPRPGPQPRPSSVPARPPRQRLDHRVVEPDRGPESPAQSMQAPPGTHRLLVGEASPWSRG